MVACRRVGGFIGRPNPGHLGAARIDQDHADAHHASNNCTRARSGVYPWRVEVGLGECHQLACVLVPELELDGTDAVSD
jgi:hypothetical protein